MWESIHAASDFEVDEYVFFNFRNYVIQCDKIFGKVAEFQLHVLESVHRCVEVKSLMSMVMNLASGVEMTLLRSSLTVRRSTVGVPQSLG